MITGVVNQRLEALVSLEVRGPNGDARMIDAVIDTGYSGYLTLPGQVITALGLPFMTTGSAALADGSIVRFSVYEAAVLWDGQTRLLEVDEADTAPLLGMAMLEHHDLHIQVADGGRVTVERR
ncbi:MAG: clan AA aspartic protease [Chloroflexi bacterium]|nr:clan AA aspartic protease [Chloroflexota bacterium]MXY86149.1 clan AA aspartic protease [Chloroflexota bacterium]